MNFVPVLAVMSLLIAIGSGLILLGQRGRAGRTDFVLGGHTRSNTDPSRWKEAHEVIGKSLLWAGLGFVVAGLSFPLTYRVLDLGEAPSAVVLLALLGIATSWLIVGSLRGMKLVTSPAA